MGHQRERRTLRIYIGGGLKSPYWYLRREKKSGKNQGTPGGGGGICGDTSAHQKKKGGEENLQGDPKKTKRNCQNWFGKSLI